MGNVIRFDPSGNPVKPTLLLGKRSGQIIGQLVAENIHIKDSFNATSELSFSVHKYYNGEKNSMWDEIIDFRAVYVPEFDNWYEIYTTVEEDDDAVKNVTGIELGVSELSQTNLYNIEINTTTDLLLNDYKSTFFYVLDEPDYSLLNRILNVKTSYYTIAHVDDSLMDDNREYTFNGSSVYDVLTQIAKEVGCIIKVHTGRTDFQDITREIYVYDLQAVCMDCHKRTENHHTCSHCGGTNLIEPEHWKDTTIFVTADELGDNISFDTDEGAVKNCFYLEAGDDIMTATVRNCNPNGTDYLWYLPNYARQDMSSELQAKLEEYDSLYSYYQKDCIISLNNTAVQNYNRVAQKYINTGWAKEWNGHEWVQRLTTIPFEIHGYSELMEVYYGTLDLDSFLRHELMPTMEMVDTTAAEQLAIIEREITYVSVQCSVTQVSTENALTTYARAIVDNRYQVKVKTTSMSGSDTSTSRYWYGKFTVTSYSDENNTATSSGDRSIRVNNTDQVNFVKQKIEKTFAKLPMDGMDVISLFRKDDAAFINALKQYGLEPLKVLDSAASSAVDVLTEKGYKSPGSIGGQSLIDLGDSYVRKQGYIENAMAERASELAVITSTYQDSEQSPNIYEDESATSINNLVCPNCGNGLVSTSTSGDSYICKELLTDQPVCGRGYSVVTKGVQGYIIGQRNDIQNRLNFTKAIGKDFLPELYSFRREDHYQNSNFTSDGLSNAELFANAKEFLDYARNDIYKSAELQHTISASLKDLLVIEKFKPLREYFELGNWIRIKVDDEIYKLRIIGYEIDYNNLENITVDFSDVLKTQDGLSDQQSVISQAQSMATSYPVTEHKSNKGSASYSKLSDWNQKGLDVTMQRIVSGASDQVQTWDEHGMLFRQYEDEVDGYNDEQLKILNSSLVFTNDNWETLKTAVGKFYYEDPDNQGTYIDSYGVNAETIVGKLILGRNLQMRNSSGTMKFDDSGLSITNNGLIMKFNETDGLYIQRKNNSNIYAKINPNSGEFFRLNTSSGSLVVNSSGNFSLTGSSFEVKNSDGSRYVSINPTSSPNTISWNMANSSMTTNGVLTANSAIFNRATIDFATLKGNIVNKNEDGHEQMVLSSGYLSFYYDDTRVTEFSTGYWTGHSTYRGGALRATRDSKYLALEYYRDAQQWEWAILINNGINIGGNTSKVYLFGKPSTDTISLDTINGYNNTNTHYGLIECGTIDSEYYGIRFVGEEQCTIYSDRFYIKDPDSNSAYKGWTGSMTVDGYRLDFVNGILVE